MDDGNLPGELQNMGVPDDNPEAMFGKQQNNAAATAAACDDDDDGFIHVRLVWELSSCQVFQLFCDATLIID